MNKKRIIKDCKSDNGNSYNKLFDTFKISKLIFFFTILFMISMQSVSGDTVSPFLSFQGETPTNNSTISNNYVLLNISINESDLSNFIFNWNGTNYSFYDPSLLIGFSFNNNSAIGENSSYAIDISKYGNNGSFSGGVLWNSSGIIKSVHFDGINDLITVKNSSSLNNVTNQLTFEVKVYPYEFINDKTIVRRGNAVPGRRSYTLITEGPDQFMTGIRRMDDTWLFTSYGGYTPNYYHVTGTFDGTFSKLYINGDLKSTTSYSGNIQPTTDDLYLGGIPPYSYYLRMELDNFLLYNKSLTADEIKRHSEASFDKINSTNWQLVINISNLSSGTYTYYGWANNTYSYSNSTEIRNLNVDINTPGPQPEIISWSNNKTNNNTLNITINLNEFVNYNATTNQAVTWTWIKDNENQGNDFNNFTTSWSTSGAKTLKVSVANSNGTSQIIQWNVTVQSIAGGSNDSVAPIIKYQGTTPPNASIVGANYMQINISVDEGNLSNFFFNWNGTNYTFYSPNLVLGLNCNKNRDIGENLTHVVDISQYHNNGTWEGDQTNNYSAGLYNSACSFVPPNSGINFGTSNSLNITGTTITFEAILNLQSFNNGIGNEVGHILSKDLDGYSYMAENQSSDNRTLNSFFAGSVESVGSPGIIYNIGNTYKTSMTYDGTNIIYYVNGSAKTILPKIITIGTTATPLYAGNRHLKDRGLNGTLDEVRLWNHSFSSDEMQKHANASFEKVNGTHWQFVINMSGLSNGTYSYYGWANDSSANSALVTPRTVNVSIGYTPVSPRITSWNNKKTNNNSLNITVNVSELVNFSVVADQGITTWSWFKDGRSLSMNTATFPFITISWRPSGSMTVKANATNENGTSNTITWNVTVLPPAGGYWLLNESLSDEFDGIKNTSKFAFVGVGGIVENGFFKMVNSTGGVTGITTTNALGIGKTVLVEFRTAHITNEVAVPIINNTNAIAFNDFIRGDAVGGITAPEGAYFAEVRRNNQPLAPYTNGSWRYLNGSNPNTGIISPNTNPYGSWETFWLTWDTNVTGNRERNIPQKVFDVPRSSLNLAWWNSSYFEFTGIAPNNTVGFKLANEIESGLNQEGTWIDYIRIYDWMETVPPASVAQLLNESYAQNFINWTWTDSQDGDFDHVMVYLNNTFKANITRGIQFYSAVDLIPDTSYTISTHTVDTSGNINQTWVNHTAKTARSHDWMNGGDATWINYTLESTIRLMQAIGDIRLDHLVNDYKDYWSLEEKTGSIIHDENTTSNNTGISSGTTWNITGGLDFDGSDYVSLMNVTSLPGNYTFVAWFSRKDYSTANSFTGKAGDTIPSSKIAFPSSNSGIFARTIPAGGSTIINVGYTPSMDNTWNFITVQRDESNIMKASLNGGVLISGSALPGTYDFNLLGRNADGQSMYGTMKNIGVWSRVLNSTEINQVREGKRYHNGNVTFWYDAGTGYKTSSFTINVTTPTDSNYSIRYRQNNTGEYILLASNLKGSQKISITGEKYQNTDLNIQLFGDGLASPRINSVRFNTQDSVNGDSTPPLGITNLTNITYEPYTINWTYTDSNDVDFNQVEVYIDNNFITNVLKGVQFYNASGFDPGTVHTIATRSVDANGNVNMTWINNTARTASMPDTTPPASISALQNITNTQTSINWTWTDSQDSDFDHVIIYINNNFRFNVPKGIQFYNATDLIADTSYTISTHTVDTSGNINQTWVNHTAKTNKSPDLINGGDAKWINYSLDSTIRLMQATGDIRLDHLVNDYKDYWSLEEGTGVIIHDENITSNNTGISSGTMWNTSGGLEFNGSDSISLTNVTSLSGNYTFVAWFNRKDYSRMSSFTGRTGDIIPSSKIAFPSSTSGIYTRTIPGGSGTLINIGYAPSMDNTWNFITVQRDESNSMKASLNGGALISGSMLSGTYNFNLLGRNADGQSMYGTMKDIAVWSRVLNLTEINQVREGKRHQNGNITFWYDAGNGRNTLSFTINATTPTGSSYSVLYRQNNTGDYLLLASNLRDSQNIIVTGEKYQNTDLKIQLFGDSIASPGIHGVKFNTQDSSNEDSTPPLSISNLANVTYAPNNINWTWTEPQDMDLDHIKIYINNNFQFNMPKGIRFYNATDLIADTSYTISTQTVDTSGNINQTWVNHTARTDRPHSWMNGDNASWINYSQDSEIRLMQATGDIRLDHIVNDYRDYWSLEERTGLIIHDENITSNNTGILSGTTWNTTGGLDFDGSDYINLTNVTSLSGNYTFVAWFNRKDYSIANSFTGKTGDTIPSSKIAFPSSNGGIFARTIPGGSGSLINVGYTPSMDNTWNFITMQRDENNSMKASLNGGALILGSVLPGTYDFNLLGRNADGQSMYGTMKNIAVWSRVLNSTEINLVQEGKRHQDGNVTFWYDAGNGRNTSSFTINATTPTDSHYSIWYRQNNTGDYRLLASNLRDSQNIIVTGEKYQNTDMKIQLFGDGVASPRIHSVIFNK